MLQVSIAIWKLYRFNLQKIKCTVSMFSIFVSPLYNGCYWCKVQIKALNLVIFLMTLKLRYSDHLNNYLVQYLYGTRFSIAEWSRFWMATEYQTSIQMEKKQKGGFYYLNTRQKASENGNVRFQMVFGIRCSLN